MKSRTVIAQWRDVCPRFRTQSGRSVKRTALPVLPTPKADQNAMFLEIENTLVSIVYVYF